MTPRSTRSGFLLALGVLVLLFVTPVALGSLGVSVTVNGLLSGALLGVVLLAFTLQPSSHTAGHEGPRTLR